MKNKQTNEQNKNPNWTIRIRYLGNAFFKKMLFKVWTHERKDKTEEASGMFLRDTLFGALKKRTEETCRLKFKTANLKSRSTNQLLGLLTGSRCLKKLKSSQEKSGQLCPAATIIIILMSFSLLVLFLIKHCK